MTGSVSLDGLRGAEEGPDTSFCRVVDRMTQTKPQKLRPDVCSQQQLVLPSKRDTKEVGLHPLAVQKSRVHPKLRCVDPKAQWRQDAFDHVETE